MQGSFGAKAQYGTKSYREKGKRNSVLNSFRENISLLRTNVRKTQSLFLLMLVMVTFGCLTLASLFLLRTFSSWRLSEFILKETADSPTHQTLPQRGSAPNSQLKTHY